MHAVDATLRAHSGWMETWQMLDKTLNILRDQREFVSYELWKIQQSKSEVWNPSTLKIIYVQFIFMYTHAYVNTHTRIRTQLTHTHKHAYAYLNKYKKKTSQFCITGHQQLTVTYKFRTRPVSVLITFLNLTWHRDKKARSWEVFCQGYFYSLQMSSRTIVYIHMHTHAHVPVHS